MTTEKTSYLTQGTFLTSRDSNEVLSTVLGSCVAACIWDGIAQLGGMNHFLLPASGAGAAAGSLRYGIHAMEMLINDLLKMGAQRNRLQAKLFGGANMSRNLGDIGTSNAKFAKTFLATEEIPCVAESLGGDSARRVIFRPTTGHARLMIVQSDDPVRLASVAAPAPSAVLLF